MKEAGDVNIVYLADRQDVLYEVAEHLHGAFGHFHPGTSIQQRIQRLQRYSQKQLIPQTLVALRHDRFIGTASLLESNMDTHTELSPWLASVYTRPEERGKGVARLLIHRILHDAELLGIKPIYLFTEDRQDYYAKFGFKTIFDTWYKGTTVAVMRSF